MAGTAYMFKHAIYATARYICDAFMDFVADLYYSAFIQKWQVYPAMEVNNFVDSYMGIFFTKFFNRLMLLWTKIVHHDIFCAQNRNVEFMLCTEL